jgi:hypothetical protein
VSSKLREAIARQGLARSQIVVLDALLKLRQVCCDPRLLKFKGSVPADALPREADEAVFDDPADAALELKAVPAVAAAGLGLWSRDRAAVVKAAEGPGLWRCAQP